VTPTRERRKNLRYLALLGVLAEASAAPPDASCVATKLSPTEARQLVMMAPEVLAIRQAGGTVDPLEWHPPDDHAHADIFYYSLLQRPKLETLPLQNGVVGHFAVNLYSARVVNFDNDAEVSDDSLAKMQAELRAKHCISAQLVEENAEISP
jgi:hypothetical protein